MEIKLWLIPPCKLFFSTAKWPLPVAVRSSTIPQVFDVYFFELVGLGRWNIPIIGHSELQKQHKPGLLGSWVFGFLFVDTQEPKKSWCKIGLWFLAARPKFGWRRNVGVWVIWLKKTDTRHTDLAFWVFLRGIRL